MRPAHQCGRHGARGAPYVSSFVSCEKTFADLLSTARMRELLADREHAWQRGEAARRGAPPAHASTSDALPPIGTRRFVSRRDAGYASPLTAPEAGL